MNEPVGQRHSKYLCIGQHSKYPKSLGKNGKVTKSIGT